MSYMVSVQNGKKFNEQKCKMCSIKQFNYQMRMICTHTHGTHYAQGKARARARHPGGCVRKTGRKARPNNERPEEECISAYLQADT